MESASYYMDQQLRQYKAAITDTFKQFQLDDESRIAAAHAVINSAVADYKNAPGIQEEEYQRILIRGMLSMAAACHLISFDEIMTYKKTADIDKIEIPFKMVF